MNDPAMPTVDAPTPTLPEDRVTQTFRTRLWVRFTRGAAPRRALAYGGAGAIAALVAAVGVLNLMGVVETLGPYPIPEFGFVDLFALAFMVGAAPFALFELIEGRRVANIEARLPDLLSDLASLHRAGLTLMEAIRITANGDYGALTAEVRRTNAQIQWGVPVLEALTMLRDRLNTPVVSRTLTVVIEAGHAGGRVDEVLTIAADIARRLSIMRRQRQQEMTLYLLIVYVASLVFLFVVIALQAVFVPKMITAVAGTNGGGGIFGVGVLPTAGEFRGLYITSAIIQAIGNGFVGGIMGEGRVDAGVKHAILMVAFTLIGFTVFG